MTEHQPTPFDDGDLYDLFSHLYPGTDFYVGLANVAPGPVLDLCCGTGRVLIPCLEAGLDVDGLDLFEPMLERLRRKAASLGLAPRLYQAEMSEFRLPRKYSLVMIPGNAFIHCLTQEAQIRCLSLCREHLRHGGLLAFDTFFPGNYIVGAAENSRVLEGEMPHPETGRPLRGYDTRTFDRVEQTQHSIMEIETEDENGQPVLLQKSEFLTRYVYKQEMALLLRVAGFARWEICADFDRRPLTKETDGMVVLAWKGDD